MGGDVDPRCPVCHGEGWITVNRSRGLGPEWDEDVRCGCGDDDGTVEPFDMGDGYVDGPSRPGDTDWADPWDQ